MNDILIMARLLSAARRKQEEERTFLLEKAQRAFNKREKQAKTAVKAVLQDLHGRSQFSIADGMKETNQFASILHNKNLVGCFYTRRTPDGVIVYFDNSKVYTATTSQFSVDDSGEIENMKRSLASKLAQFLSDNKYV